MAINPRLVGSAARVFCLALTSIGGILGCGEIDEFERVEVTGKVTIDGRPLETGTISFVPLGSGPSVQGELDQGAYAIGRASGPSPGSYRVEIYSVLPTGRRISDPDTPSETIEETRNVVPARYNLKSELRAEVTRNPGQQLDFSVSSKEARRQTR